MIFISACYGLPTEEGSFSVSLLCCLANGRGQMSFSFYVCRYRFNHLQQAQRPLFLVYSICCSLKGSSQLQVTILDHADSFGFLCEDFEIFASAVAPEQRR